MNIYLDVDGVLLDKHLQPAQCLHEFVRYVTAHHTCYWATTHVTDGSTEHFFHNSVGRAYGVVIVSDVLTCTAGWLYCPNGTKLMRFVVV